MGWGGGGTNYDRSAYAGNGVGYGQRRYPSGYGGLHAGQWRLVIVKDYP